MELGMSDSDGHVSDIASAPSTNVAIDELEKVDVETLKNEYNPEYNLRKKTIVNRIKTEKKKALPKQKKPKSTPPPMSKYRRRAANARERGRMEDINGAFQVLKSVLPNIEEGGSKMTKITTLRLAMNYISALRNILGYDQDDSCSDLTSDFGSDFNSDGDSTGTPSVSSGEDMCLSPDSVHGDFLSMDFLSDVKLDFDPDSDKLLLDCT